MFLKKEYILANELVEKMDMHIANISMLRNELEAKDNYDDLKKVNNCTFINTKSPFLPNNINVALSENTFTDMTDKLPATFLRTEFNLSPEDLEKAGVIEGEVEIAGKKLIQFKPDFVKNVEGSVMYMLSEDEAKECLEDGSIDGMIKITKAKCITWYKVF